MMFIIGQKKKETSSHPELASAELVSVFRDLSIINQLHLQFCRYEKDSTDPESSSACLLQAGMTRS
jgi:hypothetical protein